MSAETSGSLATAAEALTALEDALRTRADLIGGLQSGSDGDVAAMGDHWGGPRAIEVLTAAAGYVDAVAPAAGALESAADTVGAWATAASDASESLATYERQRSSASQQLASDVESPTAAHDLVFASDRIAAIRAGWQTTCAQKSAELSEAMTALFTASTTVIAVDDQTVLYDNDYFRSLAELTVSAGLDVSVVDPTGQFESAINDRAAFLGGEDGQLIYLILDTANQADLDEADGNFSSQDIEAACDPATVEALLRQAAEENGHEWGEGELDALVGEIVGTAWMMRASEDEAWEDIDDDIEWYERGPVNWARENLLAPLASVTVGALCYTAAAGTATVTGGVSLGAAAYCGGLAAATYNATNTWAHGGGLDDTVDAFADPQTWAIGATEGFIFQGATNFLLRAPAPVPVGAAGGVDDALVGALDDLPSPSGRQYAVAHEMELDPVEWGRRRSVHDNRANAALDATFAADEAYAVASETYIPGIRQAVSSTGGRENPAGWTWHHVPSSAADGRLGVMQLVPTQQHASGSIFQQALHPNGQGGYAEWAIPAGAPTPR